jgi:hypothetical protein
MIGEADSGNLKERRRLSTGAGAVRILELIHLEGAYRALSFLLRGPKDHSVR